MADFTSVCILFLLRKQQLADVAPFLFVWGFFCKCRETLYCWLVHGTMKKMGKSILEERKAEYRHDNIMHVTMCWVTGLYSASPFEADWLPQVPPSAPLSWFSTFTLSRSRPAWIWAVKRSSRRVWLAHFVESLNIQGGLSFEAAPGSPFVSEAALFILTYAKWSLTWGKPQKNTSGTLEVLSPTLQHPLEIRVLMDSHVCVLCNPLVCLFNHRFYDFKKVILCWSSWTPCTFQPIE